MAVQLPNGIIFSLATGYGSIVNVSGISNADPGVVTATAHGLQDGDIFELKSGWQKLNERIFRVDNPDTNSFDLEGFDTTDTVRFPIGSAAGTLREVTQWTQLTQVLELTTSGGEMQFTTYSFLEDDFDSQLPTTASAQSKTMSIADDDSLAGYQALKEAAEKREIRALRGQLPDGSVILYNGYVSFNETPSMTKGQIMACQATFSLRGRPVRN